jgi:hypothetical protein
VGFPYRIPFKKKIGGGNSAARGISTFSNIFIIITMTKEE